MSCSADASRPAKNYPSPAMVNKGSLTIIAQNARAFTEDCPMASSSQISAPFSASSTRSARNGHDRRDAAGSDRSCVRRGAPGAALFLEIAFRRSHSPWAGPAGLIAR